MFKEPATTAIILAMAMSCLNVHAQQSLQSRADDVYDSAMKLDMKHLDSLKFFADEVLKLSGESGYELGKLKAKLLATHYCINKFKLDSAKALIDQCVASIDSNAEFQGSLMEGYVYYYKCEIAFRKMQLDDAARFANRSLEIYKALDKRLLMGGAYTQLGIIETIHQNDMKALSFFTKGYHIKTEATKDLKSAKIDISNIADIYSRIGQYEKALIFMRRLLTIVRASGHYSSLIHAYIGIGKIKAHSEKDSALYYFAQARKIAEQKNDLTLTCIVDYESAFIYSDVGKYKESTKLIYPLLKRTFSPHSGMAKSVRILIATNYLKLKQYDSAMFLARQAYRGTTASNQNYQTAQLAKILSEVHQARSRSDSALYYFKIHHALNDSIYGQDSQRKLSTLYADVETLSKQNEIDVLERQSALEKAQKSSLILSLVLVALSAIFLIAFLILNYRNRKKKHLLQTFELQKELELKKKDLHEQTVRMIYLNNGLTEVEESLKKIKNVSDGTYREVNEVLSGIHINKSLEKEWDNFHEYFGSVHVGFYEKFNGQFPNVTLSEKRLASLIRMNMTNSEIAGILNIENSSVKMAKHRLKKKLGLGEEQEINTFLQTF
jgi:tetratricopeptide (TPR) repeat protein